MHRTGPTAFAQSDLTKLVFYLVVIFPTDVNKSSFFQFFSPVLELAGVCPEVLGPVSSDGPRDGRSSFLLRFSLANSSFAFRLCRRESFLCLVSLFDVSLFDFK